jgi:hypothetical protein
MAARDTVGDLPVSRFEAHLGLGDLGSFAEIVGIADWEQNLFHPLELGLCSRKREHAIHEPGLKWDLEWRGSERYY